MKLAYFLLLAITLLCVSCNEDEHISITRPIPVMDTLWFNDAFHVSLVQDSLNCVVMSGAESIVTGIDIKISDNRIDFYNNARKQWLKPAGNMPELEIHLPEYMQIAAHQSCHMKSLDTLRAEKVRIIHQSYLNTANLTLSCDTVYYLAWPSIGGNTVLSGETHYAHIRIWDGIMKVDASNLTTNKIRVMQKSKTDCHVNATLLVQYSIYNVGNIYLHGNPEHIEMQKRTSSGRLIHVND